MFEARWRDCAGLLARTLNVYVPGLDTFRTFSEIDREQTSKPMMKKHAEILDWRKIPVRFFSHTHSVAKVPFSPRPLETTATTHILSFMSL